MDKKSFMEQVAYNEKDLVPVITQDDETGEVLMLAWMNEEALKKTLETGRMTYYSRSRQKLWIRFHHEYRLNNQSRNRSSDTYQYQPEHQHNKCRVLE
jgi:phosphoribosyl-AMP cyclohydrolase